MNTLFVLLAIVSTQDKPQDIVKKDLPKEAVCVVCASGGESHGAEKPAAGVMYKGKSYYFCSAKEVGVFKKDPEAYLPPVLPRPMTKLDIVDLTGKLWDAKAFENRVVLLDWWATWCGPCKAMMPTLEKLHEAYKGKGLEVLSISTDAKRSDVDKFLKGHKFPNPVLHDTTKTWQSWGIRAIPVFHLVKDGQVIGQWTGKRDYKELATAIEAALAGK